MVPRAKLTVASALFIAITLAGGLSLSCGRHPQRVDGEAHVELAGEPEKYSATVVRTVQDGTTTETSVTNEARSGEMRRQEWKEQDQNRALIWRPDLGKSFLLDLDRRAYTEMEITDRHMRDADPVAAAADTVTSPQNASGSRIGDGAAQTIDRYLDDTQSPARVETRMLPPIMIDGHPCKGYEERASFVDGHIEITRRFRADDLAGLALRIETEGEQGTPKVTTERRDIKLDVAPDAFTVPTDFRKIDRRR